MYSNDHLDFPPFEEFGTQEEVQPFRMAACVKAAKLAKFRATSQELDYCDIFVYFLVFVSTKRPIALFRFQALVALMAMPFLFAGKLFTYGETPPPPPPRWRLGGWNF